MPAAIVLIGVPGSGKSTIARQMARSPSRRISLDQIREQLYGTEAEQGDWGQIWAQMQRELAEAVASQQSVIYDATNYKREYRKETIALLRQSGFAPITGLWLNEPLWICLMRNRARDRQVPEETIIEMHRCLVEMPPRLTDGFDYLMFRQEKTETEWMD